MQGSFSVFWVFISEGAFSFPRICVFTKYYNHFTNMAYKNKNAPKENFLTNCSLENTIFFSVYKLHVLHKEHESIHSTETAEGLKIWRGEGQGVIRILLNKQVFLLLLPKTNSAGSFLVSTTMSLIARRKKKNKKPYCLVRGRFVHFLKSRVCVLADLKG